MQIWSYKNNGIPDRIKMIQPDDWHTHVRTGAMLQLVAPMVAKRFRAAVIMPNLTPPITTIEQLIAYRDEIMRVVANRPFMPLMTLYFTDQLDPIVVKEAMQSRHIVGIKYYPRGLTTNSDSGVADPSALWIESSNPYRCLKILAEHNGVLLLHAADGFAREEVYVGKRLYKAGEELDAWDQERHFIEQTLWRIQKEHSQLKISVEHISTSWGAEYLLKHGGATLGCSITAHHLLLDRRDLVRGGLRPHRMWMPVIQPKEHRDALRELAKADLPFVWLGSDSAPHPQAKKETDCCASGVLMAHAGIELYVEAFEEMGALDDRFERFASINGARFYGRESRLRYIEMVRKDWTPRRLFLASEGGGDSVVPFRQDEVIRWQLET